MSTSEKVSLVMVWSSSRDVIKGFTIKSFMSLGKYFKNVKQRWVIIEIKTDIFIVVHVVAKVLENIVSGSSAD